MTIKQQGEKMSHDKYSSIIYKGKTLKEWAEINKINYNTIRGRIKKGYSLELAISPQRIGQ